MSPWLVGMLVFFVYPLVTTVYLSFHHYDLLAAAALDRPGELPVHGRGPELLAGRANTLWMIVITVPVTVVFAFWVAHLLTKVRRGAGVLRTMFYLPDAGPAGGRHARVRLPVQRPAPGRSTRILGALAPAAATVVRRPARGPSRPSPCWRCGASATVMIIFLAALLDVPRRAPRGGRPRRRQRLAADAVRDAADDQPGDPLRRRDRRDRRRCSTSPRATSPATAARRRRRAVRAPAAASATRRDRRCSIRSGCTSRGSSTSPWATPPRWRSCCSSSRWRSPARCSWLPALRALPGVS